MIWICVTFLCGWAGALLARRLKIPAGFMIGAMAGTAVFNVLSGQGVMPMEVKVAVQIVSGIFIGMKIKRTDIPVLKSILLPAAVSALLMMLLCMGMGALVSVLADVDMVSAMLGCAPGGIVDMSLIAMDIGADTSVISVLHMIRLITVLGVFPTLFQILIKKVRQYAPKPTSDNTLQQPEISVKPVINRAKPLHILLTAAVGGIMGIIGKIIGIPAGPLLFSMIGTTVFNMLTSLAQMPMPVKQGAQILAGTLIGINVTMGALIQLKSLLLPAVMMLVLYFLINLLLASLLHFLWHFDIMTAFFSCTPGGASDICLMVEDFGGDTTRISIMQTTRVMIVVGLYPIFMQYFE